MLLPWVEASDTPGAVQHAMRRHHRTVRIPSISCPVAPGTSAIRVYYDDTLGQRDVAGAAKLLSDN